jgi:hypothetical protein
MSGELAMGTNKITGLGDPTANQDAATKAYVDAQIAGIDEVVEDTTPQLGGDLDANGHDIILDTGAAATPSLTFDGDTNTGIYSPGADQVAVATGGVERLSISSAGEVTTTNQKINLVTVGRGAGALFTNVALGDGVLAGNTTGLYNTAIGTSALSANTTGNNNSAIGISALISNTIGINNAAAGSDALRSNSAGNNNSALGVSALYNNTTGSNNTCVGHQAGLLLTTGSNNTIIGNILGTAGLSDTVIIGAGTTERLRIDSAGNVGIGTTSPDGTLHVHTASAGTGTPWANADDLIVENNGPTGISIIAPNTEQAQIIFGNPIDNIGSIIRWKQDENELQVGTHRADGFLTFRTAIGVERARIDSSGRLLVGTTTGYLTPISAVTQPLFQVHDTSASEAQVSINSWATGTNTGGNLTFCRSDSGTVGTHTVVGVADGLGNVRFAGSDGTKFIEGASITASADGAWGADDGPTKLVFATTADGASSPTERMRIESNGKVELFGSIYGQERTIGTSSFNLNTGNFWTCGAIAIPNPTNGVAGMSGLIRVTAAPTSFGSNWDFPGGSYTAPTTFPAVAPFYCVNSTTFYLGNWTEGIA